MLGPAISSSGPYIPPSSFVIFIMVTKLIAILTSSLLAWSDCDWLPWTFEMDLVYFSLFCCIFQSDDQLHILFSFIVESQMTILRIFSLAKQIS